MSIAGAIALGFGIGIIVGGSAGLMIAPYAWQPHVGMRKQRPKRV